MLLKETISDNTIENFITLQPTTPKLLFYSKEESWAIAGKEFDYTVPNVEKSTVDIQSEFNAQKATSSRMPINSPWTGTDYIGTNVIDLPYNIVEAFADFKLMNLVDNDFNAFNAGDIDSLTIDLYPIADVDAKLANVSNGLQIIRIPQDILTDLTDVDNPIYKYGNHVIKITPKYVDVVVTTLEAREHKQYQLTTSTSKTRRQIITFNNSTLLGTAWSFESYLEQQGRLFGSVVEIWNSGLTIKKDTKVVNENILDLTNSTGQLVIGPDLVGYNTATQAIVPGDILRIYPRETYFNPIFILLEFEDKTKNLESAIRYLKNDAVRDISNGVIEIYDDAGVQLDNEGNITGNVIESYQVSLESEKEIRRNITNG